MNIYVLTCTKHAGLLGEFAERFEKYWGDPFFAYVSHTDLAHWSDGVLNFLRSIKDEYFILLHEDFYLTAPVNKELLEELKEVAVTMGADRVSLLGDHTPERTERVGEVLIYKNHAEYHFSFEASIQKRQYMIDHLKGNQDPWQAENGMRHRAKGLVVCSEKPAIFYQDKMRGQKYEVV